MPINAALETLQDSIISGDPSSAIALVRAKKKLSPQKQIAIYSDAYRIRLPQAVLSDYPCLAHFFGESVTKLIARFVEATPSQHYSLDFYPHGFWRYLQTHSDNIALGELAELEGAIAEVFMGNGSEPLTPENLSPMDEESLGRKRFHLRSPSRLLFFKHDVESAMAAFKQGEPLAAIDAKPVFMLIYRHANEVQRRYLEESEYHLLQAIETTASFNDAIQQMLDISHENEAGIADKLSRWLPIWIQHGYLARS